jgi:hypothetical protein
MNSKSESVSKELVVTYSIGCFIRTFTWTYYGDRRNMIVVLEDIRMVYTPTTSPVPQK